MIERNEMFDELLNECHDPIVIFGMTYLPADVLAECDPIAYRVSFNDWTAGQCIDGLHSFTESDFVCDWCGLHKVDLEDEEVNA